MKGFRNTCVTTCLFSINSEIFLSFLVGVPVRDLLVLANSTAELSCDTTPIDRNDEVILVLWFRENKGTPIFRQVPFRIHQLSSSCFQLACMLVSSVGSGWSRSSLIYDGLLDLSLTLSASHTIVSFSAYGDVPADGLKHYFGHCRHQWAGDGCRPSSLFPFKVRFTQW